ncbi:MAG: hypothetical protein O2992_10745 [Gemmatimonadetes bacterium]|nr:hypothetical protein [Gemmatimonadota bacterium]
MSVFRQGDFRRVVDDRHDKWIFLCAFIGGSALIWLFRHFGVDPFVTLIIPTAIMGTYTAYVLLTARLGMSLDRAGDNIYYLGLLYTLVSLSLSLFVVFDRQAQAAAVFALMSAFGLALCSTILGMFLRIFVQQFRSDPADIEKEVRADLTEAVRSLRSELYAMTADINSYRRASTQSIEELQGELSTSMRAIAKDVASGLAETAEHLHQTTSVLENVGTRQADTMEALITTVDSTIRELISRLREIDIDTKGVSAKFESVADAVAATAEKIEQRSKVELEAADALQKLIATLRELTGTTLRNDLAGTAQGVAEMAERLRLASSALGTLNEAVATSTTRLTESQDENARALNDLLSRMRQHAEMAERSTREVQTGLLEGVRALRSETQR